MLGIPYGTPEAARVAGEVMRRICEAAYSASIELAREKGAFPRLDRDKHLAGRFIAALPEEIRAGIARHGIRNSHLTAIAPTGTISLLANNVSSGLEPVYRFDYLRRVREDDGSFREPAVTDYSYRLYREQRGPDAPLPWSPAVSDEKVFTGTNSSTTNSRVYCLDAKTGTKTWEFLTASNVLSAPTVSGSRVYVQCLNGKIYCLDALTGARAWEYQTGAAVSSSPAISIGKIFLGSQDSEIHCLDEETGMLIWSYQTGGKILSSPAVVGGRIYFGSEDKKLYCLDAGNPSVDGWPMTLSRSATHRRCLPQRRQSFSTRFFRQARSQSSPGTSCN